MSDYNLDAILELNKAETVWASGRQNGKLLTANTRKQLTTFNSSEHKYNPNQSLIDNRNKALQKLAAKKAEDSGKSKAKIIKQLTAKFPESDKLNDIHTKRNLDSKLDDVHKAVKLMKTHNAAVNVHNNTLRVATLPLATTAAASVTGVGIPVVGGILAAGGLAGATTAGTNAIRHATSKEYDSLFGGEKNQKRLKSLIKTQDQVINHTKVRDYSDVDSSIGSKLSRRINRLLNPESGLEYNKRKVGIDLQDSKVSDLIKDNVDTVKKSRFSKLVDKLNNKIKNTPVGKHLYVVGKGVSDFANDRMADISQSAPIRNISNSDAVNTAKNVTHKTVDAVDKGIGRALNIGDRATVGVANLINGSSQLYHNPKAVLDSAKRKINVTTNRLSKSQPVKSVKRIGKKLSVFFKKI